MRRFITLGKRRWRRGIKTAVSLIDVAATVAIVGILLLWLVPALASVAKSSKGGKCLSNLMQIGYANGIYAAQDLTDMAIPVHPKQYNQCPGQKQGELCNNPIFVGAYEWGGKSGIGRADFVTGIPGDPLNSKYGTKMRFGPPTRPLNKIVYKDEFEDAYAGGGFDPVQAEEDTRLELDVYRCPADTGYTGIHCPSFAEEGLTSYDHFGVSYNASLFMIANALGGMMRTNSPYLHRMSDLLSPARTLAYQENNGRFAWTAAPDQCDFLPGVPGTVRGWHGKDWTFNAAFIDGHADTIYMRGYRNEVVFPEDPDRQDAYRCVIVRGEGWQLDTLPVPDVPTGLLHDGQGRPSYEDCLTGD